MRVTNNISSMSTQGALFMNNRAVSKDLEKLSTGLRVNRASDDAAGLAISEGLRSKIRGQEQAKRNAMDGISALNIAEGALNEIHNIMQRQRELAVQSSTATYSNTEREYMQQEFLALSNEIDRIKSVTNFNGIQLLTAATATAVNGAKINGNDLWVDAGDEEENSIEVKYGESLFESGGWETIKAGPNFKIDDQEDAQTTIKDMDDLIKYVSETRSDIGALVNRLETTVNNLTTATVNQQAAESQIRDVDFAYQSSSFTKNQILTQSATAMLSQANAGTQGVLSLLR